MRACSVEITVVLPVVTADAEDVEDDDEEALFIAVLPKLELLLAASGIS